MSNTTVSMRAAVSIPDAFLNNTPRFAPSPVPTMIAVGVANPRASGQVMTTTVMANRIAIGIAAPASSHTRKVRVPPIRATRTSQNAARSARRCPGALEFCASCTSFTICANAVSEPTLVAVTRRVPTVFTVAPITSDPGALSTGMDSPVTIDSSTSDSPDSTTPSVGIFAPGRTSIRSPGTTSLVGISTSCPSRITTACEGASSSRVRMASFAPPRARISTQCPSSTKVASTVAAS